MSLRPVLRTEQIQLRDAYVSVLLLPSLSLFFTLVISPLVEKAFPSLSSDLLNLIFISIATIITLVYCQARFGGIELSELVPHGLDYLVLVLALLIRFWIFGITVGPERLRSGNDPIYGLPTFQFWPAVSIIVLFGPLLEETFFRRYFLEVLRHHYPTGIAVAITIGVATLFHLGISITEILWVLFDQFFLTIVYLKSRLGVSVTVHSFINAVILFLSRIYSS